MFQILKQNLREFEEESKQRLVKRLAEWLRCERTAYVDDLSEQELLTLSEEIIEQSSALGFVDEVSIRAMAAVASVFGAFAYADPLFEPIFYSALPRPGARLMHSPLGIWLGLADLLEIEFHRRSGTELIIALGNAFLGEFHPEFEPMELLRDHFPERAARLSKAQLDEHLQLSEAEALRLGLCDPRALRYYRDVGLLLGAHFAKDPLYPWAQAAFASGRDDMAKVARLRTALRVIVKRARAQKGGDDVSDRL